MEGRRLLKPKSLKKRRLWLLPALLTFLLLGSAAHGAITKSVSNVDSGNTKEVGQTFTYILSYDCSLTSGDCIDGLIVDDLPAHVQYVGNVVTSDVDHVVASSGSSRVEFHMNSTVTNGNTGDLLINVRFRAGETPDGFVASNQATATNMGDTSPETSNTIDVTAVAAPEATLTKTLTTSPFLDVGRDEAVYRLRIAVPSTGALNLSNVSVTDTLPLGGGNPPVFVDATPDADCEATSCVGVNPLVWTNEFASITAGNHEDITIRVRYDDTDFDAGTVRNEFEITATPLGEPEQSFGPVGVNHNLAYFVPVTQIGIFKDEVDPDRPIVGQDYQYYVTPNNGSSNVDLNSMVVVDTLPPAFRATSVTSGQYIGVSGGSVTVAYQSNETGGWLTWGSPVNAGTNTTLTVAGLGLAGTDYLTHVRWSYGTVATDFRATIAPNVNGAVPAATTGDTIENCATIDAISSETSTPLTQVESCSNFDLSGSFVRLTPQKSRLTAANVTAGNPIQWQLRLNSNLYSSIDLPVKDLVLTDLLPLDAVYAGTWTFNNQATVVPDPNFEEIENFANTGRTLLRWTWNAGEASVIPAGDYVDVVVDTTVRTGAQNGSLGNTFGASLLDTSPIEQRCYSATSTTDSLNMDGDAVNNDILCSSNSSATINPVAQLSSANSVQGTCDADFTDTSLGTLPGGSYPFKLIIQNTGTVAMRNFVLVDILPFIGDTGVRDTSDRDSEWTPLLVSPIVGPPGATVYYSTSGNPCRGEVGGPTSGCDAPNWSTVPPNPITTTRSFKLDFGVREVIAFDALEFSFQMTAPADYGITPGAQAYNSFGWQAFRTDLSTTLGAEPNKVGVGFGGCAGNTLGNYVWVDTDRDGSQTETGTGLNNVQLSLHTPGDDDIFGTFDDVNLGSNITLDGPTGNAGWYQFPGLANGDYYVCAATPATYALTRQNQGDDALDSDLSVATACTDRVTLAGTVDNQTLDIGLLPPLPAALGNYVWFDRNNDGLQNESPYDGANGVSVRLYVDDGDGTLEPGGDDPEIAVTATANDVNGIPGFYRFDGLSAGVPYFVGFELPPGATFSSVDHGTVDSQDSDADQATGLSALVTLTAGEYNDTLDAGLVTATGGLSIGNQVWLETDNDGLFEPQDAEAGINGVRLSLYKDTSPGDGLPSLDEYLGYTTTYTSNNLEGRYLFDNLAPGEYFVVADLSNFAGDNQLAGLKSCTGNDASPDIAPDPDNDLNGDDNGGKIGANVATWAVTLTANGEPTNDGDSDNNTNLSVDLCFTNADPTVPVYDYGDAPDVLVGSGPLEYQTTALDTGAHHEVTGAGPYLGSCVDADNGVFQDILAMADDNSAFGIQVGTCTGGDDDDGVVFTVGGESVGSLEPGDTLTVEVSSTPGCANLNAWVDWDRDGSFESGEKILDDDTRLASGGTLSESESVPAITPGPVYSRFRCSTAPGLTSTGAAADGEVEDYVLYIIGSDFGDLPNTYGTREASNGAVHKVDPRDALMLGSCVDTEADGQPGTSTDGDDINVGTTTVGLCLDDEDGVTFSNSGELLVGVANDITVQVNKPAKLDAWIDLNSDGDFADAGEQIFTDLDVVAGNNALQFTVPDSVNRTATFARFRVSDEGALTSDGPAESGEVEDYNLRLTENFLGDFVWNDRDDDGDQDPGEPGIEGVTIFIDLNDNGTLDPGERAQVTGPDGSYDFLGLPTGVYDVCINTSTAPRGFRMTYPGVTCYKGTAGAPGVDYPEITLGPNGDYNDADFGYHEIDATISNFVWHDTNKDGIQDPGEPGIAGVRVNLYREGNGIPLATVTTDGTGQYLFPGLSEGNYVVEFNAPAGYTVTVRDIASGDLGDTFDSDPDVTSGRTGTIALAAGEQKVTVDAGMYLTDGSMPASLGDRAWFDTNENGLQDSGETGVAGVTVTLRDGGDTVTLATTSTNGSGLYGFTGLAAGDYVVCFTAPTGTSFTAGNQGGDDALDSDLTGTGATRCSPAVTLAPGDADVTIDAGFYLGGNALPASLGDFVWFDTDKDGVQDAGEPGIPSISVTLNGTGGQLATITTDATGHYLFTGLVAGDYSVTIAVPSTAVISPQNVGDDGLDSDIEPSSLQTATVTLVAGDENLTLDAGIYMENLAGNSLITIGDLVWFDANHNHQPDSGEGVAGVTLDLYDGRGVLLATTTTDANGLYLFSGLPSGSYRVRVDTSGLNSEWFQIADRDATLDSLTDLTNLTSNNLTADFGYGEPESDLELTKTIELTGDNDKNKKYSTNDEVTFTLTLVNKGPSDTSEVVVTDELPGGYTYVSSIATQGTYEPPLWSVGDLANGASVSVDIVATLNRKGEYTNIAQVTNSSLPDWDSVPSNDDGDQSEDDEASVRPVVKNFPWSMFIVHLPKCPPVPDYCYLIADGDNEGSYNSPLFKYTFKTDKLELLNRLGADKEEAIIHSLDGQTVYTASAGIFGTVDPTVGVAASFKPINTAGIGMGRGAYGQIPLDDVDGLSFDPTNGVLYAVIRYGDGTIGDRDLLIQIDPNQGRVVPDAFGAGVDYVVVDTTHTGVFDVDDIAVDSDGTLYGVAGNSGGGGGDHLIVIDKRTGQASDFGVLSENGAPVQDMEGLTLYNTRDLYGTTGLEFGNQGTANTLYKIDKQSGECTTISRLDKNFDGLIPGDFEAISCFPICK